MFQRSRYNIGDVIEHTELGKLFIESVVWFPVKGFLYTVILPHGEYRRYYESKLARHVTGHAVIGGVVQRSEVPYNGPRFLDSDGIPDKGWGDVGTWFGSLVPEKLKNQANTKFGDLIKVDFKLKKRVS